jgi:hypothetical protein
MRLRYLVMLAIAVAAAAFYVGVKSGVGGFKEVDELGEWHEVVVAGPYVVIKHDPGAYQRDFDKAVKYIEARRASWERWKKLLDKYGDETYKAYVVPCRIYTFEEFFHAGQEPRPHRQNCWSSDLRLLQKRHLRVAGPRH